MSRPRTRLALAATVAGAAVLAGGVAPASAGQQHPTPTAELSGFITGPTSPEDIVAVPRSNLAVVSALAEDPLAQGAGSSLYTIDAATRHTTELWPGGEWSVAWNRGLYSSCPGAPDPDVASPHGINIETRRDGTHDLYVVNHGGREAIEIFNLDLRTGKKSSGKKKGANKLTWIGCVPMPTGTFANGVAPLPRGDGLLATDFFDPTKSDPFSQIFVNDPPTGSLMRWEPATGWSEVPDSAMYGPNGVVVTRNGRTAFVAEWGRDRVHRIPLTTTRAHKRSSVGRAVADVPLMPDNLRVSASGDILVTGQAFTVENVRACQENDLANCPTGLGVYTLDPKRMKVTTVHESNPADFRAPTVATPVGDELWVGAVKGNRIAVLR